MRTRTRKRVKDTPHTTTSYKGSRQLRRWAFQGMSQDVHKAGLLMHAPGRGIKPVMQQVLVLILPSCLVQGKANLDSMAVSEEERARLKAQLLRKVASLRPVDASHPLSLTQLSLVVLVLPRLLELFSSCSSLDVQRLLFPPCARSPSDHVLPPFRPCSSWLHL